MKNLSIPVILGTARQGRMSEHVAAYVVSQAKGFSTKLVDIRDFLGSARTEAMNEAKAKKWKGIVKRADGLIIVSPEYNHSFPGELKIFLDQLFEEYQNKPAAIVGVSSGGFGGVRMIEQMRGLLSTLGMCPMQTAVSFSKINEIVDNFGTITDKSYADKLQPMFEELVWHAKALRARK